jgi:hypothetical protein
MGTTKDGPFDITKAQADKFLAAKNPDGRSNSDVVKPWANGLVTKGGSTRDWIIDFGTDLPESEAALYEGPYQHAFLIVRPTREHNKRAVYRERWWLHAEPRPAMRTALKGCDRYIATVRHSKHRIFFWLPAATLPDSALIVFARDDDYTLGVLQSRIHGSGRAARGPRCAKWKLASAIRRGPASRPSLSRSRRRSSRLRWQQLLPSWQPSGQVV